MTTTGTWTVSGARSRVQIESGGTLIASNAVTATNMLVDSGGTYQHNQNGGTIPTATWDVNSTCSVTGWGASTTAPGGIPQSFGNFNWNSTGQTGNLSLGGNINTVNGNFTVSSTGTGSTALGNTGAGNLTIGGNYIQTGGTFIGSIDAARVVTINGNLSLSGGTFNLNSGGNAVTVNVAGNFSHTAGTITESGSGTAIITMNGTNSRTFQSLGQSNSVQITINKTGTATNDLVTLSANSRIDSNLTLILY